MFKYSIYSSLENGLINYWPFTNNVDDSIGAAHLYDGVNSSLTYDRFGYNNSALRLNSGYYSVPPGVYFNGSFTTSAWVNAKSYTKYARVFDFGNGQGSDNIIFGLLNDYSPASLFIISIGSYNSTLFSFLVCDYGIILHEWIHLAVTFESNQTNFYYNGILCSNSSLYEPSNVIRKLNFIGKSNWPQDELANAVYDELRIYNRVLTLNEINSLMYF